MLLLLPNPLVAAAPANPTFTAGRMAQIDTGAPSNGNTAPAGWNNWSTGSNPPANTALLDTAGASTGWTVSTPTQWTFANSGTTTNNNSGIFPDAVIVSNWYTSNAYSNPFTININGLDNSKFYDIRVLGSRTGTTDRGTTFAVLTDKRNQIADNNTSNVSLFEKYAPAGGVITLKVATGLGTNGSNAGFGYVSAITVQEFVRSAVSTRTSKVAFRAPNGNDIPPDWNMFKAPSDQTSANVMANMSMILRDSTTQVTGWTIANSNAHRGGINGSTTGNNSGVFSDEIMSNGWFNGDSDANSNGGVAIPTSTITLSGLTTSRTYTLVVFGSRNLATRNTIYTINGNSQNLDCANNTSRTVTFANVTPDSSGKIVMTWERQSGQAFGYLNAMTITENKAQ